MAYRLTDSELAERVRAGNRRAAARQYEKRRNAGKAQLNIWLAADVKAALAAAATANGETVNATAERLLLAGLDATTPDAPATRDNPPVYTVEGGGRDALMTEVGKLLDEGHTGADIARRLAAAGYRSPNGAALTGGNLLRDYRAWLKKAGAAVAPRV